jgi:hypothetical protein
MEEWRLPSVASFREVRPEVAFASVPFRVEDESTAEDPSEIVREQQNQAEAVGSAHRLPKEQLLLEVDRAYQPHLASHFPASDPFCRL